MPVQSLATASNAKAVTGSPRHWILKDLSPSVTITGIGLAEDPTSEDVYLATLSDVSKISSSGQIIWTRTSPSGLMYNIANDPQGNLYTVGGDTYVAKYDKSGQNIWTVSIDTASSNSSIPSLAVSSSGEVYVSTSDSGSNAILFKLSSSGSFVWGLKMATGTTSQFKHVAIDEASDRVYASGYVANSGGWEGSLIAANLSGTLQWQKNVYESSTNRIFDWGLAAHGGMVYVGYSVGYYVPHIYKLNSSGSLQYSMYGGDDFAPWPSIAIDKTTSNFWVSYRSGGIVKYSPSGSPLLYRSMESGYMGQNIFVDKSGNVLVSFYNFKNNYAKLKSDGSGTGLYFNGSLDYLTSSTAGNYVATFGDSWISNGSRSISSFSGSTNSVTHTGITARTTAKWSPLRTR